ncbi:MAG: UvrD-helicase domain-containing protein [Thermoflexales bacterium]|nr:UvrD-helicase domain-containing protein [Thermoflexales bacterium]
MLALLESLNSQQRAAVTCSDGPTLVLAGPGSGKTRVLTSRAAYLCLTQQAPAHRIFAVTFTNKAAREMRDRLVSLTNSDIARDMWLGTFHSLCARILRREAPRIGLSSDFVIYDASDQLQVVKAALADLNIDEKRYKPDAVRAVISAAKNELIAPEHFQPKTYFEEIAGRVYPRYNAILRANNALDFDDLLAETAWLLQRDQALRERLQARFLHVLVDEFQDTNIAQYVLLKLLAGQRQNLFCVGDPDQGIYAWRGADHRNVQRLQQDFPNLRVIALQRNYRSTQVILDAAMAVIRKNPNRVHIDLVAQRKGGQKIVVRELFNEEEEAQYIVDTIAEIIRNRQAEPGEIAVMYRTNAQSRPLEEAFVRAGVPYRLVGATRFYARREIKDVIAYLRIVHNPADTVSLQRVINVPARGIGEKTFRQLELAAREHGITPLEAYQRGLVEGRAAKALGEFCQLWAQWIRLRVELNIRQLLDHILQTSGYLEFVRDGTEEGEDRWGNILEFRAVAASAGDMMLGDFLNEVALVSDVDNYDENANVPTLLTLHAAKGLEFRVVFIAGLTEGVLPHSRSLDDPEELAEERRLMYVGITRAKEQLYLLYPFRRAQWGESDVAEPSRFLLDLPPELIEGMPSQRKSQTSWTSPASGRPRTASAQFKPGDRVIHPRFGKGIVLRSFPVRDDEEVEVFFVEAGSKRLSAALSGLKKVGEDD